MKQSKEKEDLHSTPVEMETHIQI